MFFFFLLIEGKVFIFFLPQIYILFLYRFVIFTEKHWWFQSKYYVTINVFCWMERTTIMSLYQGFILHSMLSFLMFCEKSRGNAWLT